MISPHFTWTLSQVICLPSASSLSQARSKEPHSPLPPLNGQGEANKGDKKNKGQEKATDAELPVSVPSFFPPRALLARTPHSKAPGEGGKGNAHYSMYPFCTQWKGMASDIPFNSSRVSMAKSLPVRWCWARECRSSLFGPVSWRGIELPSGVWNRSICLNQSSCHHVEMLWPSKDTTCNMDETCPQSNDAIFFLSFNK